MNIWTKSKNILLICFILPCILTGQIEICDNGIDDDGDSLIDLNDDDCACDIASPLSLIPNPSFEETDCCPNDHSQLYCATDWIQASGPTTDLIHTCDFMGWIDFPPPQPFPDGEGIMGFRDGRLRNNNIYEPYWKEYAGACLINPLLQYTTYVFQFDLGFVTPDKSPEIEITFFGTTSCDFLPFGIGDNAFGCPTNSPNWIKLGEVTLSSFEEATWVNTNIEIIPQQDIYAIAIGPPCEPAANPISNFYFFDNLILADIASFDLQISPTAHPCNDEFSLSVPNNPDYEYQWYLDGVALLGEVFPELSQNYGEGTYQVRILDGAVCKVSVAYDYLIPSSEVSVAAAICDGDSYELGEVQITNAGSYIDTLKNYNNCDSIVTLQLETIDNEYETMEVAIYEGETFEYEGYSFSTPGEYDLILPSSLDCYRNIALTLTTFNIYIPNAFSPDGDGINDFFSPLAASGRMENVNIKVFSRWGNLVYEGPKWDGSLFNPGVFTYLIDIEFAHGISKSFSGSVTLLR